MLKTMVVEKNEMIVVLSVLASSGVGLLILYIILAFNNGIPKRNLQLIISLWFIVVSLLFMLASYRISICEYKKMNRFDRSKNM